MPYPPFDLYAELDLSPTATQEEIEKAWKALLREHHPDAVLPRANPLCQDWLRRQSGSKDRDQRRRAGRRRRKTKPLVGT